ncbi:hypothetical protein [Aquimarina pacifica]|uniref:hypothetical protein n=1 Tax=Aquimarina pacifica TaxID=1296415 RepID=UPI0004717646|nr:hypothetical protein [Aquimarina pacifica]
MKKSNALFATIFIITLFFISCGNDDNTNSQEDDIEDVSDEDEEDTSISTDLLKTGVIIEDLSLISGTPPSPNSDLDFSISTNEQDAFLNSGFNIAFSSTDEITGAYIQLQDTDGNNVDGYFDVPKTSFDNSITGKLSLNKRKKNERFTSKANDTDFGINVDFEASVPVGRFCYVICLYDAAGNVSQIQEVCVDVNAWGGNNTIVGEWIYDRSDPEETDDQYIEDIECTNGETLMDVPFYIDVKDEWTFVLSENGDYYEIYDEIEKSINSFESVNNCSAIYDEYTYNDKYSGKWSYNEEDQTITVVDFGYEDLLDSQNNEEYPEGQLYFEGAQIEVINGELVISDTYSDGDSIISETLIFKRK